jgi:penicillin-binding protein 1A
MVALGAVAAAGLALAAYTAMLMSSLPDSREIAEYRPPTASRVFSYDGQLIGEFAKEKRILVDYEDIPPVLINAFLAAEDRTFWTHGGIDYVGVSRAMLNNVGNVIQGRRVEGGSTITQQVAKNVLLTSDVTIGRKVKEAILAGRLEETLSKQQILELYMNEVFLGYGSYGVGAAAQNYFGKRLEQLTPDEAAYLAALLKGPNNYHPRRRKEQAMGRRNWILGEMAELGWLPQAQAQAAMRRDLVVQDQREASQYAEADFFVEEVRRRAVQAKWGEEVNEGGYYIRTTLDPAMQDQAKTALMNGIEAYDRRHGWRGAWGQAPAGGDWTALAAKARKPAERTAWQAAMVDGDRGSIRLSNGGAGQLLSEDLSWARAGTGLQAGDLVWVELTEGGRYALKQVPEANGAIVAIDPWTGRVKAMVGGYSFTLSKLNRATQANRQPGSAFKPFVYATALENGWSANSRVLDAPVTFRGANGQSWTPENYSRRSYGWQSLRNGLVYSRNQMTVRLAQSVGMRKISADAIDFGITDKMEPQLAMALGSGETTPYKLTAAYAAFVNGGRRISPHLMEVVHDRDGKTVYRAEDRRCPRSCATAWTGDESPRVPTVGERVIDPKTAYAITGMLQGVVQSGTATKALVLNRPVAGKTGTTNEYRSAWFVGYTPDLVVGVFVGFDDNRSLGQGETGGESALPVFVDFMGQVYGESPAKAFLPPDMDRWDTVAGQDGSVRAGDEPGTLSTFAPQPIRVAAPTTTTTTVNGKTVTTTTTAATATRPGTTTTRTRPAERPRPAPRPRTPEPDEERPERPAAAPPPPPPPRPEPVPEDLEGLY